MNNNVESSSQSLSEIYQSVNPQNAKNPFKRVLSFFGPALLISIGYMDPGNWATDIEAGSRYGYKLLFILLMSNLMALLLQSHAARLGIVRGRDLAQVNRFIYPRPVNIIFYLLAEFAIIAMDLAEILGMALGIKLLFGLDLIWGVGIAFVNTFLILLFQRYGIRKVELLILGFISVISLSFFMQVIASDPNVGELVVGLVPTKLSVHEMYISIGIIGATVMPHNLYLHSALVQSRKIGKGIQDIKRAIKMNFWDSAISLNLAFFVNAGILILAASTFHKNGHTELSTITEAYQMLDGVLNKNWASALFAIALILAGQSSTFTGTLAGQVVMEGYLKLKLKPFQRQLLTRSLAIVPAVLTIVFYGDGESEGLLVFSQVILSLQLAFAVIPLIFFVSAKSQMNGFHIGVFTKIASWLVASIICGLNLMWLYLEAYDFYLKSGIMERIVVIMGLLIYVVLLSAAIYFPVKKKIF